MQETLDYTVLVSPLNESSIRQFLKNPLRHPSATSSIKSSTNNDSTSYNINTSMIIRFLTFSVIHKRASRNPWTTDQNQQDIHYQRWSIRRRYRGMEWVDSERQNAGKFSNSPKHITKPSDTSTWYYNATLPSTYCARRAANHLSTYECLFKPFDLNKNPLAVPGTRTIINERPKQEQLEHHTT